MIPEYASEAINAGPDPAACAAFIIVAFVLAGIAQVLWFRSAASRSFSFPLDGGITVGGKRIFGDHKMLRGVIVMLPAAGLSFGLLFFLAKIAAPGFAARLWPLGPSQYLIAGLWAGLGFVAGELPNSFIKRRLDIAPGGIPRRPALRVLFFLIDRLDSIAGMLLALGIAVVVPGWTWVYVASLGLGIHWGFSALLYAFHVKERMA